MDLHLLLQLIISPVLLAGIFSIIRRRQWLRFCERVYNQELSQGRRVDATTVRFIEACREPRQGSTPAGLPRRPAAVADGRRTRDAPRS